MDLDTNTNHELHAQVQYRLIEKLSESERRYRELVESLREIVFNCDQVGCFTFLNAAWNHILGYGTAESLHRSLVSFLHPDDQERGQQLLEQLQNQQAVIAEPLRFYHQTGAVVWLELSAHPTSQKEQSGSLNDITDRKRAEVALQEANEALEMRVEQRTRELKQAIQNLQQTQAQLVQTEKISSLGQLVAGVAHEINNPVNFIYGNLGYVEDYAQDLLNLVRLYQQQYPHPGAEIQAEAADIDLVFLQEDLAKILNSMKMGTERIRQIVLSLRNFSRMDEADFKAVDIHEGIDSTLMILHHRLKARPERTAIDVVRCYGNLPPVECYPGQLNQVLMNLIANAIDALEEDRGTEPSQNSPGQITIQTTVIENDWIEIAIADNGPGIPASIRERIFDPFFTTKPIGKGTGMGLSISHQIIVEKHGGRLKCCSAPDQGTQFTIQIPVQQVV